MIDDPNAGGARRPQESPQPVRSLWTDPPQRAGEPLGDPPNDRPAHASGADGGRAARSPADAGSFGAGVAPETSQRTSEEADGGASERRRSRRGSRGGRRRRGRDGAPSPLDDVPSEAPSDARAASAEVATERAQPKAPLRAGAESGSKTADAPAKRRSRSRRKKTGARGAGDGAGGASDWDGADDADDAESSGEREGVAETTAAAETKTARPRRRGGRRRRKAGAEGDAQTARDARDDDARDDDDDDARDDDARDDDARDERDEDARRPAERESAAESEAELRRRRRRGSRGGRGRKKRSSTAVEIESIPGEDDDLPDLADLPDEAELVEAGGGETRGRRERGKKGERDRERKRKTRRRGRADEDEDDDDEPRRFEEERTQVILVNASGAQETRVAVVDRGKIADLQMTVETHRSLVNGIYRGRVVNIEPAIGAAFVDFGQGRNGFLHASDVMGVYGEKGFTLEKLVHARVDVDEWEDAERPQIRAEVEDSDTDGKGKGGRKDDKRRAPRASRRTRQRTPITDLLKKGQLTVVQITKDAIGDKGPTLTTYISIPGRYLVLMPSLARTGVSRKIEDEKERRRLKRILQALHVPDGMGVIVRTAGIGKTKDELKRDLDYLLAAWDDFCKWLPVGRHPTPLYEESDVAIRTMRDLFTSRTEAVYVDDERVYERMRKFTETLMPENVERIHLHTGSRPLFHTHSVEQDFERIFARRVELPSGGSIVFDQTEALVAIDVNSGRTREEGAGFEEIALKTNLEAAPEIARQIRLRDLGGIIVVDFIDMTRPANRRAVEKKFRDALNQDRARSKVGRISQFGLLELTRQRLGPGLSKLLYDTCSTCRGSGRERTSQSRAEAILRRLGSALSLKGFTKVEVRARPEVIADLEASCRAQLDALHQSTGRELILTEVPDQTEDSVLRYLRADGREVRPGGRRKR